MFFAVRARKACLSDINPQVVRTYKAIQSDASLVANLLAGIPHHAQAFNELRQFDPSTCSDAEAAARLIFLMKSCFNGVYRENRAGSFNTPWGGKVFKLPDLPSLLAVQRELQGVAIEQSDFSCVADRAKSGDFVYLDPPYPQRRYRGEFGSHFTASDVERLIRVCHRLDEQSVQVMLSYVVDDRIASALKGWRSVEVRSTRSVASRSRFRGIDKERVFINF